MKKNIKLILFAFVAAVIMLGILMVSKPKKLISKVSRNIAQGANITQENKNRLIMREFDKTWKELNVANSPELSGLSQNEINFKLTSLVVPRVMQKLGVTKKEVVAVVEGAR